jgi:hypothetical protein
MRRVTWIALLVFAACGSPYDLELPPDPSNPSESFKAALDELPDSDAAMVAEFMVRLKKNDGVAMAPGTTVRAAIDQQRQWVEKQKVERAKADAEAAVEAAKRAAELAKMEAETAKLTKAHKLIEDTLFAFKAGKYTEAKARADEALVLAPGDEAGRRVADLCAETLKRVVAGKWLLGSSEDKMSDDKAVYVSLVADNTVEGYVEPVRPVLVARCSERKLSLDIRAAIGINPDYGELYTSTGRTRFDQDPAQKTRFGIVDSRDAVFFPNEPKWISKLVARHDSVLHVEIPTYQHGGQIATFSLAGADLALKKVLEACAKK